MEEPDNCPQCKDKRGTWTAFQESKKGYREVGGKRCDECEFEVYNYGNGWEW